MFALKKTAAMRRRGQLGNFFFLVLLVVGLIGYMSYWFTSGSRGGGNFGHNEASLIVASQIAATPAAVRQTTDLMRLHGRAGSELRFNADQTTAAGGTTTATDFDYLANVFNPAGEGGATWTQPPPDALTDLTCVDTVVYSVGAAAEGDRAGCWYFKRNVKLPGIGIDATADIVQLVVNLKQGVCEQINSKLFGSTTIEDSGVALADWTTAATAIDLTGGGYTSGRPFACVMSSDGVYLYYHTIVEQ